MERGHGPCSEALMDATAASSFFLLLLLAADADHRMAFCSLRFSRSHTLLTRSLPLNLSNDTALR